VDSADLENFQLSNDAAHQGASMKGAAQRTIESRHAEDSSAKDLRSPGAKRALVALIGMAWKCEAIALEPSA
jgi:hypothetical protein